MKSYLYRIINKIRKEILRLSYNYEEILEIQNQLYKEIGLDRKKAKHILEEIYIKNPNVKDLISEHHLLFSAVSMKNDTVKILEIGTYTASCTKLLSELFPYSNITTIDLHHEDPIFKNTYERQEKEKLKKFIFNRDKLLQTCSNVEFIQKNSLTLYNTEKSFDLIWVDGAHGYPVVAMDIINSLRCLSKNGRMFIDDVWTHRKNSDPNYRSIGAYESLVSLESAGLINFSLIPKRIEFPHGKGYLKKYIAVVNHIKEND